MFSSFKIDNLEFSEKEFETYLDKGKELFLVYAKNIKETIDSYLLPNGSLDANNIENDWFPQLDFDIFISHSHDDLKQVIAFAGYLDSLGLKAFVDSSVWWMYEDFLKKIDDEYCLSYVDDNGKFIYDYKTRNKSTAYVHMILNGALMKMIDKTECLIFIETPNSIKTKELKSVSTESCWIYDELLMSSFLRRKEPKRVQKHVPSNRLNFFTDKKPLIVEYKLDTSHLVPLTVEDLEKASCNGHKAGLELLDQLYINKEMVRGVNFYGGKNGKED